jgi:YHS domain-containing protein
MRMYVIAAAVLLASCTSKAQKGAEVFQKNGAAIGGYDPVAFFSENKPVEGSANFTFQWKDATWRFASQQNLDSFRKTPERYAPQYGGYCAYGTAEGHKAPTEADTWTVLDGKLYFNYNRKVKALWDKDRPRYIEQANRNWEQIKFSKQ